MSQDSEKTIKDGAVAVGIEEKYLLSIDEAAAMLGWSRDTFKRKRDNGKLGPLPVNVLNRKPQWVREEIRDWCRCHCPNRVEWMMIQQERAKARAE